MERVISVWDRDVSGGAQEISKVGAIFLERRKRVGRGMRKGFREP